MVLKLIRLENRLLFDASAAAVIADAVADGGEGEASVDPHEAPAADIPQESHAEEVNVLVVSSRVENAEQLAELAAEDVVVVLYDAESTDLSDLFSQVEDALGGRLADSIAFATHGQSGMFHLAGDQYVTADLISANAELQSFWQDLGSLMQENGRLDLLGCNIAGNDFGLISALENVTAADVAASNDTTTGSDWSLEVGGIDASFYFGESITNWSGSLATFTVNSTSSTGAGSLRQAIIDANADPGTLDTIVFDINVAGGEITFLSSPFPDLEGNIIIDGTTADNYEFGTNNIYTLFSNRGTPFTITGDNVTIKGLNVQTNNNHTAIVVEGNNNTLEELVLNQSSNGVLLSNTATNNVIRGSYIGLDNNGNAGSAGNSGSGILVTSTGTNTIENNFISDNQDDGIQFNGDGDLVIRNNVIGLEANGLDSAGNGRHGIAIFNGDTTIGGASSSDGNVISDNTDHGIYIVDGTHTIQNNIIGLDELGTTAKGNGLAGVKALDATSSYILDNTISANSVGIDAFGTDWVIQGNKIGTDIDGTTGIGNSAAGIQIDGNGTLIGGALSSQRNIISGNGYGIDIANTSLAQTILGNYIGTDIFGTEKISNTIDGIYIRGGTANHLIGGVNAGERNIISGNVRDGINSELSDSSTIRGNYIGLDVNGDPLGNGRDGIHFNNANTSVIGDLSDPLAGRNYISSNTGNGIYFGSSSDSVVVVGNYIGLGPNGEERGNGENGISISSSNNEIIGGTAAGQGNTIAYNQDNGVYIDSGSNGNIMQRNIFFGNGIKAINLSAGANGNEVPATLESAIYDGDELEITGIIDGPSGTVYRIEFFASNDGTSNQAELFLGFVNVTTASPTPFVFSYNGALPSGEFFVTNTATNIGTNNTSELGAVFPVTINENVEPADSSDPLAEPLFYSRRAGNIPNIIPVDLFFAKRAWGYPNVEGTNQLTSFGQRLGYAELVRMGDETHRFNMINGEPFLMNRSQDLGYGNSTDPVGYYSRVFDYANTSSEIQDFIEELAGSDLLDSSPLVTGDMRDFLKDMVSWFKQN